MPNDSEGVKAQLCAASGRSSKVIKDAQSIEVVVEVPGRGALRLSVQGGGGYALRAQSESARRGEEAEGRDLVAVGVLDAEEVVSVVPG